MNTNSVWVFYSEWRTPDDVDSKIGIYKNKGDALARLRGEVQELWDDFEVDKNPETFEIYDNRDTGDFTILSDVRDIYARVSVEKYMVQ